MDKLKAYGWQLVALALGALLLVQTLRLADASQETAQAIATLNTERAANERQARTLSERYRQLEGQHREKIDQIGADASAAIAAAGADAGRARVARDGLRHDLAAYLTQHRAAAQARAAAGQCAPDNSATDMLAELQRRADDRAGELAHYADDTYTRGAACERTHDEASALNEAAAHAQAQ